MNKTLKWTLVGVIGVGLAVVLGLRAFKPHVNEELKDEVVKQPQAPKQSRTLNVQAVVLDRVLLADELFVSGNVMPDEEVSLAFETSGKVTEILFQEGAFVRKGDLLAKINDEPLSRIAQTGGAAEAVSGPHVSSKCTARKGGRQRGSFSGGAGQPGCTAR